MARTIGLELSTQSAKIVVLDDMKSVIYKKAISFDGRFPGYKTKGGVLHSDKEERHTSPYMLLEAIDASFQQMKDDGVELDKIDALKLDAMQHCTVYLREGFGRVLEQSAESDKPLAELFRENKVFTRKSSPIWEDRTTAEEVEELTTLLKPLGGVVKLTGNRAEKRFPAAQIMKWIKDNQEAYRKTQHILLLSAFATSILAGKIAPADTGDGWGTNLNTLDADTPSFDSKVIDSIQSFLHTKNLQEALGSMVQYDQPVGKVNRYFSHRYGLNPGAIVLAGTGDNPATLLGCGGGLVLSLGSSYTLNGVQKEISPSNGEDNVFGFIPGRSMSLVCFTNGGKLHEVFLRRYVLKGAGRDITAGDWEEYESLVLREGFGQHIMLPYLFPESVPVAPAGIIRHGFDEHDTGKNISALYFSQMAALRNHSRHMEMPAEICMVGGGAQSPVMRQLAANIFDRIVYTIGNAEYAAPLGCAIAAMRHVLGISYEDVGRFIEKIPESVTHPVVSKVKQLRRAVEEYDRLEKQHALDTSLAISL